ncbi:MAG: sigma-70 family RNA polymerase sigma factor [Thermoanaerobaculia bacterium]
MPTIETVAPPSEELALLTRLRAGNDDAFTDLVRANTGRLLAVARRMLRQDQEAQDAVQEAFVCAFKALGSFEGQCRLSTWLHRIAVNACLMRLRRRERKPEESIDDLLPAYEADGHTVEQFRPWDESALARLERDETRALVRSCIDRLPETYRTALLLRDIEEMDSDDAAALLGITPNALKIRVHRGRQALRTLLDPHVRSTGENRPPRAASAAKPLG